jgi:transposase
MPAASPRLSGSSAVDRVHGIDSTSNQTFSPTFWFEPEIDAMPVQATMFSRLLQHVPWGVFDRAVKSSGADARCRRLDARSHLVALIAGQLIEAHGLRDIEAVLAAHAPSLQRRRITPACRSTLCDANKARAPMAFEALIAALLAQLSPSKRRLCRQELRLVDSTLIAPGHGAQDWAQFQNGKVAAKVHVVYDPRAQVPTFYELSSGNTNDITLAKAKMPIEAGATYVFDLGYYDFGFWAALDAKNCRLVTRLKKNTPVAVVAEQPVAAGGAIVRDAIVRLPARMARSRRNPFANNGRMVVVATETGKTLRLFTNDLDSSAETIADLYRQRWQIELFFRWVKQHLKIRRFHGRSANAVRLQIAAAIITYLLIHLMRRAARTKKSAAHFLAGVRCALFHRIDVDTLVARIERRPTALAMPPSDQLEFVL